jgi:dihydroflavonol-4-reductase
MRVLVTGANGHIGCNVVRACMAQGMEPVAFVRPKSDRRGLTGVDVEVREGDLLDPASITRAVAGTEIVFHVGAVHRNWAPEEDRISRPAVDGTRHVLDAARRAGVRHVVCTSTAATVGFAADPAKPLDERASLDDSSMMYVRAKLAAEKVALAAAAEGGMDVVVVNPSGVFGPLDYRVTPATRAIVGLLQGDPMFFAVSITDVRDVAAGHVLAATKGASGKRYLLTGEVVLPKDGAALFKELGGVKPPTIKPPRFVARWIASSAVKKALKTGDDAAVTPEMIDMAMTGHLAYDARRARNELGATFRPARDVLHDTFRWLIYVGALKPRVAAKVRATLGARAAPDPSWPPVVATGAVPKAAAEMASASAP